MSTSTDLDKAPSEAWFLRKALFWGCFAGILLAHVLANVNWQAADIRPIRTDEETHMKVARDYFEAFTLPQHNTVMKRLVAIAGVQPENPVHPPLLHLLGALMIILFGYDPDIISFADTPVFLIALVGCYLIARRYLCPWHALYTMLVVSMTPIVFCSSRYFMTDFVSMAVAIWAFYALLRTDYFHNTGWVFVFAMLNGLGILARTQTFMFYLLPCTAIALMGLRGVLPRRGQPVQWAGLRRLALNWTMTVVVTLGVFMPWYYRNIDFLYDFWTNKHLGGRGGPMIDYSEDAPAVGSSEAQAEEEVSPAPARQPDRGLVEKVLHPRVAWVRYPLHLLNNAFYLPLFLLCLAGMAVALSLRRFRNLTTLMLLLYLLGSWAAMTLLFKYANPRYALPAVPLMAIFAPLPLFAIAKPWLRRTAMGVVALFLGVQFFVLSFVPVGRLDIPVVIDPETHEVFQDPGIVVYKPTLVISDAYAPMGAPQRVNFRDRIFGVMLKAEREKVGAMGDFANYQRLNLRGFEFAERHFWPEPNPYHLDDIPWELVPKRRLRSIGMGMQPEELLSMLSSTDYIIYALERWRAAEEPAWIAFFEERGFQLIDHFTVERLGRMSARDYGVLARKPEGELVQITQPEDLDALSRDDLYTVLNATDFEQMSPEIQAYARNRFEEMLRTSFEPYKMSEEITCVAADVERAEDNWFEFTFIFRVEQPLSKDWRIYFTGTVRPEHIQYLPESKQVEGYMDWNFNPEPPASSWKPGRYVAVRTRISPHPIPYWMSFGFFSPPSEGLGQAANLGWIDFGQLP